MARFELVVFDLAGTTVDDGGVVVEVFARTLAPFGIVVGPRALRPFRGANQLEVLRHFLRQQLGDRGEAELATAGARFRARRETDRARLRTPWQRARHGVLHNLATGDGSDDDRSESHRDAVRRLVGCAGLFDPDGRATRFDGGEPAARGID
jgi:beta-phosphoglucomutase-like phosphatase (HAD superfamily)